ncbi:hypothetical protein F3Y22_tig00116962pilonHSYRG00387 [Hibiscus syriacus]|uniref:Uncharacterized protein n=1 Tax=Hibiscus syriacus TaxID=106335 RepID=A0A6A2WJD4_HIBSY|nr:hypothetical protein F3Y22_tig00116962pilonHSYRG00387 [Hibiscus syriacus]
MMGRNLTPILRRELANLDKDVDSRKSAIKAQKSYVRDLDSKAIPVFLAQVSETKETRLSYQRKGQVYLLTNNEDVERFIAYISVSQDDVTLYVVEPRSSEVGKNVSASQYSKFDLGQYPDFDLGQYSDFDDVSEEETDPACNDFDTGQYLNFDDETAAAKEDVVDDNEEEVTVVNEHVEHLLCNSYNPEEEKEEEEVPEEKKKKKMPREYNWNMP